MKELLENILPKVVFIGQDPYYQPAYLDLNNFEYNMSNDIPNKNKKGLSFINYSDFEDWSKELNKVLQNIEKEYSILKNKDEISNYINKEFNYEYLPKINLNIELQIKNSVILSCKMLLENIKERNKINFNSFLRNNKLGNNIDEIKKNIKIYKETDYSVVLKKYYHHKFHKIEDPYSILRLSEISNVPFIMVREFILNLNKIEDMRNKRLQHFK